MNYDAMSAGKYTVRVTEVSVSNGDNPATLVRIENGGAGEYVTLAAEDLAPQVGVDPDEWPVLRAVMDAMVLSCRA